ncbi:MAG: hypothetical protein GXY15_06720 [Candidatus Hydrogenedentes bacterium]|nr:hypothetical protein [Candidatus Hydrogenedentota bacterium]
MAKALRTGFCVAALCAVLMPAGAAWAATAAIVCPEDASPLTAYAARELRRYVHACSGELLPITDKPRGHALVLSTDDVGLGPQEYRLLTVKEGRWRRLLISGGDETGLLYGVYRFAGRLGVRFHLHGDVLPDEKTPFAIPMLDETGKPLFHLRGIQPFHDFAEGPDWWSRESWLATVAQLPKLGMNFVALHTYPLAEPTVWVGTPEDAGEDGRPRRSYATQYLNTGRDSGWGFRSRATSSFCCGAGMLFEDDLYGADYLRDLMPAPATEEEKNEVFHRTGAVLRDAFTLARALGVKTCVGTETPLRIPPYLLAEAVNPEAVIHARGGSVARYGSPIADTEEDPVYQTVRYNLDSYHFRVPSGTHRVTLKFCEVAYDTPGARVFDVSLEGNKVIEKLDIFARVGKNRAFDAVFDAVEVTDGSLDVVFGKVVELPAVAGIIVEGPGTLLKVNCGGDAWRDYAADQDVAVDPAFAARVYEGVFTRILRTHPLDYYWFWTPEDWTWSGTTPEAAERTAADLAAAHTAWERLGKPFGLATCGWVLGPQFDRAWLDAKLPGDFAMSCINRDLGFEPVDEGFSRITGRGKWAIPWIEDDPAMTIPQFWAGRMRRDARAALERGCDGLLGIHWRTRVTAPTVDALARAAWDQDWPAAPAPEGAHRLRNPAAGFPVNTLYTRADIEGTDNDPVYQTARVDAAQYVLPVPAGEYTVTLHFCETVFNEPGGRVFDVALQGLKVVEDLDILQAAGGMNRALDLSFGDIRPEGGAVVVSLLREKDWPSLSGISVEGEAGTVRVNCGGGAWGTFSADAPLVSEDPATTDFYAGWAAAEFGPGIAREAAALFARLDGCTPRPATWVTGPGTFFPDPRPWEMVAHDYAFVDAFARLGARVTGAGPMDRFVYWRSSLEFLREAARMNCAWGAFNREMEAAAALSDEAARRARARETALPARIALARAVERAMTRLLMTASTPGELGTIANFECQSLPKILLEPGEKLAALLGGPLPPEAHPSTEWNGPDRLFPLAAPACRAAADPVRVKALTLAARPAQAVSVYWRPLGRGDWRVRDIPRRARGVFEGEIPAAELGEEDVEYYLEARTADGGSLVWPAAAPTQPHSVVVGPQHGE